MKSSIGVIISSILEAFSSMQDHFKNKTKQNKTIPQTKQQKKKYQEQNHLTIPKHKIKQMKKRNFHVLPQFFKTCRQEDRRFLPFSPSSTHEAHVSAQRKIIDL